jgi:hypothetical protein
MLDKFFQIMLPFLAIGALVKYLIQVPKADASSSE